MTKGGWIDPEGNYGFHSRQWLGHSFRYFLAAGFLSASDTVLDAACGVGYGTAILAKRCALVYALDNDPAALAIAEQRYSGLHAIYRECDLDYETTLPQVDVAVSFETIEHLERDPHRFAELLKVAAKRLIIISAPVTKTVGINSHHRHDFTEAELIGLVTDDHWRLWEQVRQGPYLIIVSYYHE